MPVQPDKSGFLSFLDWLDRPGQAVRNLLAGNPGGAGRQAIDFLGDIPDAVLPGKVIPNATTEADNVSGSDLVGIDKKEHPFLGFLGDVGVGTLTDPLTWLGIAQELIPGGQITGTATLAASLAKHSAAAIAKGASEETARAFALAAVRPGFSRAALKVGIPFTDIGKVIPGSGDLLEGVGNLAKGTFEKLPQSVQDFGSAAARKVRLTADAARLTRGTDDLLQSGDNAASLVGAAGQADVKRLAEMLPPGDLRKHAFDVANNLKGDKPGEYAELLPGSNVKNPLLDIVKKDDGVPLSDIQRRQPAEDYLMVKKPGESRGAIDPGDTSVGIKGVAVPDLANDVLDTVTKDPNRMWDQVFNPARADKAAEKTLNEAYPFLPTDPRFASGIDVANKAYIGKGKVPTFGPDPLKPSLSELPRTPTGPDAIAAARDATEAMPEKVSADVKQMLGGMGPEIPKTPSAIVPENTLNRVNEMLGGAPAAVVKARGDAIPAAGATFDTIEGHMERYGRRIDALPIDPAQKDQLKAFWDEALPHVQEQYARDVKNGVMFAPQGIDPLRQMPADYVQRRFTGMLSDRDVEMLGQPNALKERSIKGSPAEFLNNNPDVSLNRDIVGALSHRVEQDARMTKSATIGNQLIDQFAKQANGKIEAAKGDLSKIQLTKAESDALAAQGKALSEAEHRTAVNSIIDEIGKASPHTDDAILLRNAVSGQTPRGAATAFLAKTNRLFKPYAVYGAFIPKIGSDVRNALSGVFQTAANKDARGLTGRAAMKLPSVLFGSINDGIEKMFGVRFGKNEFGAVEDAFKSAKGDPERALAAIKDPMMREAVAHNVIDNGFVSAEVMTKESNRVGWSKWWRDARDWPAVFFKGVEQRMRYGLYKGLRETHSAEDAARITRDTLYDYKLRTNENRLARDIIPFFQFQAKAIPQTAKFIAEQPAAGVAMAQALNTTGGTMYPWMEGKTNIPLGRDEQGNQQYATGTGLPFESMNLIPTSARDVEKNIVGSTQPLLKTALSKVFNVDPYFETPYGSYSKIPGYGEAGAVGRGYNQVAGTGMIQPLDSLLRLAGQATDDRHTPGIKALDLLTGVNVVSVDPLRAKQQQLQQMLQRNPGVGKFQTLYAKDGDPELHDLLRELNHANYQAKKQDKQAMPADPMDRQLAAGNAF